MPDAVIAENQGHRLVHGVGYCIFAGRCERLMCQRLVGGVPAGFPAGRFSGVRIACAHTSALPVLACLPETMVFYAPRPTGELSRETLL